MQEASSYLSISGRAEEKRGMGLVDRVHLALEHRIERRADQLPGGHPFLATQRLAHVAAAAAERREVADGDAVAEVGGEVDVAEAGVAAHADEARQDLRLLLVQRGAGAGAEIRQAERVLPF